ncbi:MAG: transcriptional repressor [Prevotella sp.]|jgi:Fe2+ or Zn2+ uptake regulation protein|nr:transcriptional repressor [Prevotella sp.]
MDKKRRNTKTKQMVMSILETAESALCHEDIENQLSGQLDRVTIYRILQRFYDDGKIHKISGENGKTYYALCHDCNHEKHNDNHLHFHCISCKHVFCIDAPISITSLPSGYNMQSVSCIVSGYCPDCADKTHLQKL